MCCVEVASSTGSSSEYPNCFFILDWYISKESYEPDLVIDLVKHELLRSTIVVVDCITFNSGLDDMTAAGSLLQLFCVLR